MDVRMVQSACGSSLLLEAKQTLRVCGAGRSKYFYGNVTAESRIVSPINLAHSARAQQRADFVSAEPHVGRKGTSASFDSTGAALGPSLVPILTHCFLY